MFDVSHNPKFPFIVQTYCYDVRVFGTKFDVVADEDEDIFSTSLLRGSVAITDKNSNELVRLRPNEMVQKAGDSLASVESASEDSCLWTEGIISVEGLSFEELMLRFERSFGMNIVVDDDPAPKNMFSGKLRITDGIEHAFDILKMGDGFVYTYDEGTNTYHIR